MIVVRYSEIALKGLNRPLFEKRLVQNIKYFLKDKIAITKIFRPRGRIHIFTDERCDSLRDVFGISSFSYATCINAEIEEIKKIAVSLAKAKKFKTFRISAKRLDKEFMDSMKIERIVGKEIVDQLGANVSLEKFDLNIGIEILRGNAYVFTDTVQGRGGLPVGCSAKVLISGDNEKSQLAGILVMKRGCSVIVVGKDAPLIEKYSCSKVEYVMGDDLEKLATEHRCKAIIDSACLEKFEKNDSGVLRLHPLIGMTEKEITEKIHSF